MTSRSARVADDRPFYALHADAYDQLITDAVEPWVDAVERQLMGAGFETAKILDAGCGTGRHARALMERGHTVSLMDASAALLAIASRRCPGAESFHGDLCDPPLTDAFDAVVCRGVLNDLIGDDERDAALSAFATRIRRGGLLVLDVREAEASQRRADGRWRSSEAKLADGGTLTFRSRPSWTDGRIVVDERYELVSAEGDLLPPHEYRFEMRPWTTSELESRLTAAEFVAVQLQPGIDRRTRDRLFVIARR